MKRILTGLLCVMLLIGCDSSNDRFEELTGSKSRVERVYTCSEVAYQDAVRLRVLRDRAGASSSKEMIIKQISEADTFAGKLIVMLDEYSSDEVTAASIKLDKRFTPREFAQLFEEYGSLLQAHCTELVDETG